MWCAAGDGWNSVRTGRRRASRGRVLLTVERQEVRQAADGLAQVVLVREEHDAEMLLVGIVEARALHQHHARGAQHFHEELAVVGDGVHGRVEAREHVQRRLGFHAAHARDRRDEFVGQVALPAEAPAFADQVIDALVAAQRRLDRPLSGHVGAQLDVGEHVDALDVVAGHGLVARHHHPAGAVAARAVGLGERIEGEREHVGREARHRGMALAVVEHLVVHLVGQQHEAMIARDLHELAQQLVGIERARGIVRVDHHQALGTRRDPGADVLEVRHPAVRLIAEVVHRPAAGQARRRGPERIVGGGHQQLVAVVEQRIGGHGDQVARAIAQVDVVERHALHALLLAVVHHGLARREDALAVRIACRVRQVADHVLLDLFGCIETERREVADVELDDLLALVLHLLGRIHDGAPHIVENVIQLRGLVDRLHRAKGPGRTPRGLEEVNGKAPENAPRYPARRRSLWRNL